MNTINRIGLLISMSCVVFACTSETQQAKVASNNATVKESTVNPVGKPGAPITMQYQILNATTKMGEEIEIAITLNSTVKSPIQAQLNKLENITVVNQVTSWQSSLNQKNEREPIPNLKLIVLTAGTHYIRFVAQVEQDGVMLAKPFVIPLKVGSVEVNSTQSPGTIVTDEKGETVIVQEAESNNK